jgi:outer membrane protein OmpA-like peptidoglycan-associated protein
MGVSPQNRPLTYTYSASAGTISGSGTTASYSSAGAPTGSVGITCNVADDKGGTATNGTTVEIVAPPPPPQPHASALCSISFDKDMHRPTRVDNEAKACLDQVTSALKNDPTATVVVVGESTAAEKAPPKHKHAMTPADFAAQRAVNTKDYLVTANGIDASRVTVATGTEDGQTVQDYLVPSGATFATDVPGTTPVDESAVKPEMRKPLGMAPMHHKAAMPASN